MITPILLSILPCALAEGIDMGGVTLHPDIEMFADITSDDETISWETNSNHNLVLYQDGSSKPYATVKPDNCSDPLPAAEYRLTLELQSGADDKDGPTSWSVNVKNTDQVPQDGRLSSRAWKFLIEEYSSFSRDFYILTSLGDRTNVGVVEAEVTSLQGEDIEITANTVGNLYFPNLSVAQSDADKDAGLIVQKIYLNDPGRSTIADVKDSTVSVTTTNEIWDTCDAKYCFADGNEDAVFQLLTDLDLVWQITCDLNDNGETNLSGYDDLLLMHQEASITNEAEDNNIYRWDLKDNEEGALPEEVFTCQIDAFQGPIHFFVGGADSGGVRLFARGEDDEPQQTLMFWNDEPLQEGNDYTHDVASEPRGTSSDSPSDAPSESNSHVWGTNYSGSDAWIDTWMATEHIMSAEIILVSLGESIAPGDHDGDGVEDLNECEYETDLNSDDSDDDGVIDGDEFSTDGTPYDTDRDNTIDALDEDDDGDGVNTKDETYNGNNVPMLEDSDNDDVFDYLDIDDDNDGVLTSKEYRDTSETQDPYVTEDVDGDGLKNWIDSDSDDDGILDGDEKNDANDDETPDYLQNIKGNFSGGAIYCSTAPPVAALCYLLPVLVVARRRRSPDLL